MNPTTTSEPKSGITPNSPGTIIPSEEQGGSQQLPDRQTEELSHEDLTSIAVSLHKRFDRLGELNDIHQAIEYAIRALEATPDGHPDLASRHGNLGLAYFDRFERLGELDDLEKSIELELHALALTSGDRLDLSRRHNNLGSSYGARFHWLGELGDLEKAIEECSLALELTPPGHPELSARYGNLGKNYCNRFLRFGGLEDLERSIEYYSSALELTPEDHPELFHRKDCLGWVYGIRFKHLGELDDIEKSLECYSDALALTPEDHPDLSLRHVNLGVCYADRFRRLGEMDDLETSIEHKYRALELTPGDHPGLSHRYANLGMSIGDRSWRLGSQDDLGKSIEYLTRAISFPSEGNPDMADWHAYLGLCYSDRFRRQCELDDLEKAIEHSARALSLTPDDHPDLSRRHDELGVAYDIRFRHLGELDDLEKAIKHKSRATALTPEDHPDLSSHLHNLGVAYSERFQRLDELDSLEKAVECFSRALEITPNDHPVLSIRHAALGWSYTDRFRYLNELEDLEKSIEHKSFALALTPQDHPDSAYRHADLGDSYSYRCWRLGESKDLEKTLEHYSCALALTPDGHPALSARHSNQAEAFLLQYQQTDDPSYLEKSMSSFRRASQLLVGAPRDRFRYALRWAKLASEHSTSDCIEAYQTTIDLLPQFIWLGVSTNQRYHNLMTAESLAVGAANAAIRHSDPEKALEWLEHARCVVWNQTLILRSPVDQLQSSYPDLATRLKEVAKKLNDASSNSPSPQTLSSTPLDPEQIGQQRRGLAKEYSDLLAQARELPEFSDFLQPIKADRLVHAARNGPIVVINCHEAYCDALIMTSGRKSIKHLPLPNFTAQKAHSLRNDLESSLRHKGLRERGIKLLQPPEYKDHLINVLLALWNDIVQPVLNFLGFISDISTDNLPHITWCPTDALSFLPLHAAGDYGQPQSRVFDYAISSYTPTLTSLLSQSSPASVLNRAPRVLAVGQANTPGHNPLPGTVKELAYVMNHTQAKAGFSQFIGSQATIGDVLDAMEQHDWVHLACHAHQNIADPTKSGFFLHDGTLDLSTINRRSFKNKGLAFLSACQTATGDEKLPDEAIHLASGILIAGYPSVIATMWSVHDKDAPLVADKVYGELMKDGKVTNGKAGKALHYAVATLRDEVGERNFARWVPYIHIGS